MLMKGLRLLTVLLLLAVLQSGRVLAASSTVEITIGGRMSYSWWKPAWSNGARYVSPNSTTPISLPYKAKNYTIPPTLMYGFTAAIGFLDAWIFSASFMYGNFFALSKTPGYYVATQLPVLDFSKDIKRYDINADLGYQALRYIRVNVRVKTRSYNYVEKTRNVRLSGPGSVTIASAKSEFVDVGPGLGIDFSVPLYRNLSFVASVSGFVLSGSGSYTYSYQYLVDALSSTITLVSDQFGKESFYSYSGSGAAALQYFIQPAGVTLQLGGRYEIIYYRHHKILRGFLDYNGEYDHFYSVSFAAMYSFTLADTSASR
jgi:hypothetical protein